MTEIDEKRAGVETREGQHRTPVPLREQLKPNVPLRFQVSKSTTVWASSTHTHFEIRIVGTGIARSRIA
jgi:hypothetical protein